MGGALKLWGRYVYVGSSYILAHVNSKGPPETVDAAETTIQRVCDVMQHLRQVSSLSMLARSCSLWDVFQAAVILTTEVPSLQ